MTISLARFKTFLIFALNFCLLSACAPARTAPLLLLAQAPAQAAAADPASGFAVADGSRLLTFPPDFGAHPDFRAEWWYYTGNLQTSDGRNFGFELTIFRVSLLPPAVELPTDSKWYSHSLYFAHFAVSDIADSHFYAFERYSRPGPGLSGAEADPYHVWLENWSVSANAPKSYHLQAQQEGVALDLVLTDQMGVVLQGEKGYSRKGEGAANASYYYSQPRLQVNGTVQVNGVRYQVSGLAWNDHEFSTSVLDKNQIGWDWFSLQFDDGSASMLYQLRERNGGISAASSGTWIAADGSLQHLEKTDFEINVLDHWKSPHSQAVYPASWQIKLDAPKCDLKVIPWMADQELNFQAVTYWEGAVRFDGTCDGRPAHGNGYIELTGYAGNVPLP